MMTEMFEWEHSLCFTTYGIIPQTYSAYLKSESVLWCALSLFAMEKTKGKQPTCFNA